MNFTEVKNRLFEKSFNGNGLDLI